MDRLDAIQKFGECQEDEFRSLRAGLEKLNINIGAANIGSELQQNIRALLDRSDAALSSVIQGKILAALQFEKMNDRDENREDAHSSTFDWLLDESAYSEDSRIKSNTSNHDDPFRIVNRGEAGAIKTNDQLRREAHNLFVHWLSKESGIFHISGKPGAGKSTLMKHISTNERTMELLRMWAGDKRLVIAKFFFWRHGTEYQRSFKGLLRSLLHSILAQYPDLIKSVFPKQWEMARQGIPFHFLEAHIKDAFDGLIHRKEVCSETRFAFFIDGLDEFEGEEDRLIKALFDWVGSSTKSIKFCVSSRELTIFQTRFASCPKFRLHELTQRDILTFIQETLSHNEDVKAASNFRDFAEIGALILDKAEGVFLWVSLVLKEMERGLAGGDSFETLKKKVDFLPIEVERLFRHIFVSIQETHPIDRRRAFIILDHVLQDTWDERIEREPRLLELSFLEEFERDVDFAASTIRNTSTASVEERLKRYQKQIDSSCRGFVNVVAKSAGSWCRHHEDVVVLAHRSLAEFLHAPEIRDIIQKEISGFNRFQFWCQTIVAGLQICNTKIPKESGRWAGSFIFPGESSLRALIKGYFMFEGASLPHLFTALERLEILASKEAGSTASYEIDICHAWRWENGHKANYFGQFFEVHPSKLSRILAIQEGGLYELWPLPESGSKNRIGLDIYDALDSILCCHLGPLNDYIIPPERVLQCFAFCLSNGLSTEREAYMRFQKAQPIQASSITIWHLILWHSMISTELYVSPELLYTLFLVYGAKPNFWLRFDPFHDQEEFHTLISVTGLYGQDKRAAYTPIYIPREPSGILDLAERNNWLVSLRDLIGFWFAKNAEKIQRLIDMNANRNGSPDPKELKNLATEYGFDLESWAPLKHGTPRPLFETWSGATRPLDITFEDTT